MPEPQDPLAPIRSAWRGLSAPPPARELAQEDAGTRRVVLWLQRAYEQATPVPIDVPQPRRRAKRRHAAAAAALLLAAAGAVAWGTRDVGGPPARLPAALDLRPRILLTAADRTVITAGVVRLTLLNPAPPEEEPR